MKVEEYFGIVDKTAKYPQQVENFGLAYATMGLFDEMGEFLEVTTKNEAVKEAGDVVWYIAAICKETGISFEDVVANCSKNTKINPIKLLGLVKKYYRDNKQLNLEVISNILKMVLNDLILDAQDADIKFDEILEANYKKLTERHETNTISGDGETVEERLANA